MKLYDLLDKALLARMYDEGYVKLQVHPSEPLGILNYTDKATYSGEWNPVTRACRGLIYNMVTEDIVARPFDKFFNYEQLGPEWLAQHLDDEVEVFDKLDGSLGIIYREPGSGLISVATRGSFQSDQAVHATQLLRNWYYNWEPSDEFTYCVEIVYPENRIVLDYRGRDDLILLGVIDIGSGVTHEPLWSQSWRGPVADSFGVMTVREALSLPKRDNAEGVVLVFPDGDRVKVKQDDYVALHRILFGMNDRAVWEALGQGKGLDEIKAPLPEEFWPWVDQVADGLIQVQDQILMSVWEEFLAVKAGLPEDFSRKDFALAVKDSPNRAYLFKYLDGQGVSDLVWKTLKPPATRSLVSQDEDVA